MGTVPGSVPFVSPEAASAAPGDNFTLDKVDDVSGEALIGEHVTYTITASGTHSSGVPLYNLSFSDVLVAGTSFVASDPAPTAVLSDVPNAGETTLIWENVADLPANSQVSIDVTVDTNPDFAGGTSGSATVPVGSSIVNVAEAAASADPFTIPDWSETSGEFTGDFDGTASATNTVAVIPFRVTKTGPDELLRGVHQNGFDGASGSTGAIYTVQVESNPDYPITSVTLTDTLDPGLEFLGCDNYYLADNTTIGDEWAGSGPVATGVDCAPNAIERPTSIETAPSGATVVDWTLGDFAAGQVVDVRYQAGIPLFANEAFAVSAPTGVSLGQGRNLDNNTGPSTGEPDHTANPDPELLSAPEQGLANLAEATGTYSPTGAVTTADDEIVTESEDLRIVKSVSGSLKQGSTVLTTLEITASEYRDVSDLVVRDLMPSSLCFLGGYNTDATAGSSDWNTNDCLGAGTIQSTINGVAVDAARARELPDGGPYGTGRLEIVWDFSDAGNAALASLPSDGTITITYVSVVRAHYRGGLASLPGEPVLAGDRVTNRVEVSGADGVADGSLTADAIDPDGGRDGDTSRAELANVLPSIAKRVAEKSGVVDDNAGVSASTCANDHSAITWTDGDPAESGYGPGDIVCFELGATFPAGVDYEGVTVQDLLPPGYEYLDGSATRVSSVDSMPSTTVASSSVSRVTFDLGGGQVDETGNEFRWTIAAALTDPAAGSAGDINANLLKLTHNNNGGFVFQMRDQAAAAWSEPEVRLAKGIRDIDDGAANGPDEDGSLTGAGSPTEVRAGDVVTFRVDVWNEGTSEATETEVWDVLPEGFTCADISTISDGGICADDVIVWTGLTVPLATTMGAGLELTYDLEVPATITSGDSWSNTAGVAAYESATNQSVPFVYHPANNIDPASAADENTGEAHDIALLESRSPEIVKNQATGIDEAGNAAANVATIGEIVRYEVTATIPEGTSVENGVITDVLPSGVVWHRGPGLFDGAVTDLQPTVTTSTGSAALAGGTVTHSSGTVTYELPTTYSNAPDSGDDEVTISFYVRVDDISTNTARPTITQLRNTADFGWDDPGGNAFPPVQSGTVDTDIAEPNLAIDKTHIDPLGIDVGPGDLVTYQIDVTNSTAGASNVSTAHDVTVVDNVPAGLTPLGVGAAAVADDGDLVDSTGVSPAGAFVGTWSQTNRTITWTTADWVGGLELLEPDDLARFTYRAQVDDPAVASAELTNTAAATASSLDQDLSPIADPNSGDGRDYVDSDDDTVALPLAAITKDLEPFNPGDGSDDRATATVGEPVSYQVAVTMPTNTAAFDATLFDELPTGLVFDSFDSIVVAPSCEALDPSTGLTTGSPVVPADIATFEDAGGTAGRVAWFLGDLYADGDCEIAVSYTAHVDNSALAGDTVSNDAELVWNDSDHVPSNPTALPAGYDDPDSTAWTMSVEAPAETFTVIEPNLRIDKDVTDVSGSTLANPSCDTTPGNIGDADGTAGDGCDTEAGATLRYTVTVESIGTSPAHDITVVDLVPDGLTPLGTVGGAPVSVDGDSVVGSTGATGIWSETNHTITWTVAGPLASGSDTSLDYDARVDPSDELERGNNLTNVVTVPSYFGLSEVDRAQIVLDNPAHDDLVTYGNDAAIRGVVVTDSATVQVHFPELAVEKAAGTGQDVDDVRLDQPFAWTITVTNTDAVASAYDIDIDDVLPEGWTYDAGSASIVTPYGTTATDPSCTADVGSCDDVASLNVESLSWNDVVSGSTEPLAPGQAVVLTMTATPQSAALVSTSLLGVANTGPTNGHINAARATATDASGSATCCSLTGYGDDDSHEVFIARADIEVEKTIDPLDDDATAENGPYWFGSFVNYTITVDNLGPDTATNVAISDVLDSSGLSFDSVVSISQGSFDGTTNIWTVGSMPNGSQLSLTMRTRLVGIGSVTNVAQASATDQYDQDSTPANDDGAEDDQDEVTIEAVPTSLGDFIWLDRNGDGIQDPAESGIPDVPVTISWIDPGPAGAPMSYSTTTTANGSFGVPPSAGLPADTGITVTIDDSTPNLIGLTPSFDRDGTLDHTTIEQVTAGDSVLPGGGLADLDFDFGYTPDGNQQIGDKVWWDVDKSSDASDGVDEPGLPGIDVTATWAGFDGVFGTADDEVYETTTDTNGDYLFDAVPVGIYQVELDASDLPMGLDIGTYDLDGVGTSHRVDLVLDPAEKQLDVDFSYSGAGRLGDTVWFDHDGDGEIDAGEPGIGDVAIVASWDGPNGIAGDGDDIELSTVTAPDGSYEFTNLPDGEFSITLDPATLPGGLSPTHDDDGIATAHSSTATLTLGARTDLDQDFGYRGAGEIGDTVFYDIDGVETDGIPDAGDAPLEDIDVVVVWPGANGVLGDADDFTYQATTDATGNYLVSELPHGTYSVTVDTADLPAGLTQSTYDDDGAASADTSSVTLDAISPSDLDQDFSYTGSAAGEIGDTVWFDHDGDGEQSGAIEVGFSGVGVTLVWYGEDGALGDGDDVTQTTVTDGNGRYLFGNLPEGNFSVSIDPSTLPLGLTATGDGDGVGSLNTSAVSLSSTERSNLDQDFGYRGSGSIGDLVWFDIDGSADATPGTDEPGLAGVAVTITWTNPQGDDIVFTTTTDADGGYLVDHLPHGGYSVSVDPASLPGGMVATFDADGTATANQSSTSLDAATPDRDDLDFAYAGIGSIGDTVWFDQNDNGAAGLDGQDQPLGGIDIIVTFGDLIFEATTNAAGEWLIPNLPFGSYTVEVDASTLPAGIDVATFDADGIDTVHVSTTLLDAANTDRLDQDFSYTGAGSLGDTVWFDRDGDGIFDDDEVALGGVDVTLTYLGPDGSTITLTETTGPDGTFGFTDLPFGVDLTVTIDDANLPDGFVPSHDADGIATPHVSVTQLSGAGPVDMDQDFGFRGTGSIGDQVWLDRDGSATPEVDPDDVGLADVDLTVTWTNPTTGDDLSVTVSTDADGRYLVDGLPHGDYTVTLVDSTLPDGVEPNYDADGVTSAYTSTVQLDVTTPENLDQDFSVVGTGSIGDTVWLDDDADGVLDVGEIPLAGVDVTITTPWFTETVTTDDDGTYSFDRLPAGDYTITIDPKTLPDGAAPTHDLDGTVTPDEATITLTPGADVADVDFGYRIEADLSIDKRHTGDFALGRNGSWLIEVTNNGAGVAEAPVTVIDQLPEGVTYVDAGGEDWSCDEVDSTVTCVLVDSAGSPVDMAAGEVSSLGIEVSVELAAVPSVINSASVSSPTTDPDTDNNTHADPTAVPLALLDIAKTLDGTLRAGGTATYRLVVTNQGPSVSTGVISLVDDLPSSLEFVSGSSDGPDTECSASGQAVTCTNPNPMAVGATWTVEIEVTVASNATGQIVNSATVFGGNTVAGEELADDVVDGTYDLLGDPTTSEALGVPSTTADDDAADATVATPSILAFTGSSTLDLVIWALMLVGVGGGLLLATRRRRAISLPA